MHTEVCNRCFGSGKIQYKHLNTGALAESDCDTCSGLGIIKVPDKEQPVTFCSGLSLGLDMFPHHMIHSGDGVDVLSPEERDIILAAMNWAQNQSVEAASVLFSTVMEFLDLDVHDPAWTREKMLQAIEAKRKSLNDG